ncbi:hypothetical protein A2Z67_01585 [Candidatus Woesebacteria bacterium RBG_13_36_22]|uniref:CBU-0592-like domain-containing protein n=1 Tax=Candidatus Woesebacteria bacterium RBG_13_36_22 TaxID=1802478 RepID=A0A1F7X574_9BACT|nr:MAG: hypothetical protein A2Z67_01585 [Candidatus Woesebacteria bacterium RBG_13_36_22]
MIYEIVGWTGTFAILLAYLLVTTKKLSADDKKYQTLNVIGAVGIIINSGVHGTIPSVGLNTAWLLIGLYGLIKAIKK